MHAHAFLAIDGDVMDNSRAFICRDGIVESRDLATENVESRRRRLHSFRGVVGRSRVARKPDHGKKMKAAITEILTAKCLLFIYLLLFEPEQYCLLSFLACS